MDEGGKSKMVYDNEIKEPVECLIWRMQLLYNTLQQFSHNL